MSRMNKDERLQKKITYMREQLERFLWKHYRLKMDIKVFAKKKMQRQYIYSRSIFPEVHSRNATIEVEFDYDLVNKRGYKTLLPYAFREAVRIGMWGHKRPFTNGSPDYERELRKHHLPSFGGVAETGKELHSYGCSKCKRPYVLKERKLTKSKDPSQQNVKTGCCGVEFEYFGQKFYNNEMLQKMQRAVSNRRGMDL